MFGFDKFFSRRKYTGSDPIILSYEESLRELTSGKSIEDTRFLVFDIEGTDLDTRKGKILSIGGVMIDRMGIDMKSCFHWIIQQDATGAEIIHEILPDESNAGVDIKSVLPLFLEKAKGAVMIGHCLKYDLDMINRELKDHFDYELKRPYIDTLTLANRVYAGKDVYGNIHQKNYSLTHLCEKLDIEITARHDALEDAYLTALVFLKMASDLNTKTLVKSILRKY